MQPLPSREDIKALIEEATVDCYNEYEQICGLYVCLEENLKLPFTTQVLGLNVEVRALAETESDIVAECYHGQLCQRISLRELPLPEPLPLGAEWILAFRQWHG